MKFTHSIHVAATPREAWVVIGDQFGSIAEWSVSLSHSELDGPLIAGTTRTCLGTGFGPFPPGEVKETLNSFDPASLSFAYTASSGLPPFVRSAINHWSVHPTEEGCRIDLNPEIQLAWWARPIAWLLPTLLRRDTDRFSEELRHRIENGTPHPRNAP